MKDRLTKDREKFSKVKRLSFIKRCRCKHDFVYLGIDNQYKVYGCMKCGKYKLD
ncbi:hypothetical protein A5881_002956 [Enterococcus termitis]|nr:hypothetical protein A5881_002389 [Enterococcus termitis]